MTYSFKDLQKIGKNKKTLEKNLGMIGETRLSEIWHLTRLDSYYLLQKFPENEGEFLLMLSPVFRNKGSISWVLDIVFERLNKSKEEERLYWLFKDIKSGKLKRKLNIFERKIVDFIDETGFLKQFKEELIATDWLVTFATNERVNALGYIEERGNPKKIEERMPLHRILEIKDEAYKLFVKDGLIRAAEFLYAYRGVIRPHIIKRYLEEFKEQNNKYRGFASNVCSSNFEIMIEDALDKQGVFYRRQIPYWQILGDRSFPNKYRADFVLIGKDGKVKVIEGSDENDEFIHTLSYRYRMGVKKEGVEQTGNEFYEIRPKDDLNEILERASRDTIMPEEALVLDKIKTQDIPLLTHSFGWREEHSKQERHYWRNEAKGNYLLWH